VTKALTKSERAHLADLEAAIDAGMQQFKQVGLALLEIKRLELYRGEFPTWEDYCQVRWRFTRQRAFQLVTAAEVAAECQPLVNIANERQARALAKLPAGERAAVAEEASASAEPVTAKRLEELTAKVMESLSPERQRELVEASERMIMEARPARQVGGEDLVGRARQCLRLAARLKRLTEGFGPESEKALTYLESYKGEIGKMAAAA
jgi:hypothetical protein